LAVGGAPVVFLAVFFAWPVAALIRRGFHDAAGWTIGPLLEVLTSARTGRVVRQTLGLALAGTLLALALGLPGAHVLYRLRWPGRRLVRAVVAIPFVLPSVVVGVAFRALLAPGGPLGPLGLDQSGIAIVAALVFFNYAVVVRTVGSLWAGLDPRPAQAALSLGASRAKVWRTVTWPALVPAVASAGALVFLFCASAFGVVLVLGGGRWGTVETEIWYQTAQLLDLPAAAGLSIVQLVIVSLCLAITTAARRRRERALSLQLTPPRAPGRSDCPAVAVTAATVAGLVLPLVTLVARSLETADGWGLEHYAGLAQANRAIGGVSVWRAGANSLTTAAVAAGLALLLGTLIAHLLSRRPASAAGRRASSLLDAAFMLPLGVSAVTVGFGFLIALNRPPLDLRSSWALVPIAQALVALPLVVRTLLPTWRAIDPRLRQAAASLGAGPARIWATVDLPLGLRAAGLAAGFAFATSLGEFGATSFLARPDRPTLPVVVYRLVSRPGADNFGLAMAAATVLATLTAAVMAAAETIGPKQGAPW
jgi:thiamine transport system permease protein